MSAVSQISGALLAELKEHFQLVEVSVSGTDTVRLKCKMPSTHKEGSIDRRNTSLAYGSILKSHGVELEEKPVVLEGMTGFIVSGKIKSKEVES